MKYFRGGEFFKGKIPFKKGEVYFGFLLKIRSWTTPIINTMLIMWSERLSSKLKGL